MFGEFEAFLSILTFVPAIGALVIALAPLPLMWAFVWYGFLELEIGVVLALLLLATEAKELQVHLKILLQQEQCSAAAGGYSAA